MLTKEDYLKERVPVTLKRPESEKKEFRTVSVNGVNYQIAYGKQVLVPRFVAEIIKESEKNEQIAQSNADALAQMVKCREETNRRLIDFYTKAIEDQTSVKDTFALDVISILSDNCAINEDNVSTVLETLRYIR